MNIFPEIKDKIKGLIFGQAIGDALGLASEFLSKEEVSFHYPDGINSYSQIIQDKHRSRWGKGDWTDDTDQFLCILTSLLNKKEVDLLDIANELYLWSNDTPMGIGVTTYKVLNMPQYTLFPQKAAKIIWKIKKKDLAPNGALMRNSIVGVWKFWELDNVLQNSENIAELTHFDQRCKDSCKTVSYLIASELNSKSIDQNELKKYVDTLDTRLGEYISFPISAEIDSFHLDEPKEIGYTLKALSAGLWAYYNANNFKDGIKQIIEQGGDADTNGCIAGSLLGAKFGFNAIPSEWVNELNKKEELNNIYSQYINLLELK